MSYAYTSEIRFLYVYSMPDLRRTGIKLKVEHSVCVG